MNSSAAIRKQFIEFFASKGHRVVGSSSLVPAGDDTLLFTNAGMVQFKDLFLGNEQRDYKCAVTSQCCVRAGGKHNDLENVGYTARHHTFFEMLGNFSFGDYFKQQAIEYAWEFLTDVLKLPADKLWVTVYEKDQEAEQIWLQKIGIDPARFSRIGAADNFWQMGETGPCGPCTEIFYDHGAQIQGGPPGSAEEDGDRFIEIWNLVFMQYNRDANQQLSDLPKPSVDTGMGLERLAAILQGVHSNYEIDLFVNLIAAAQRATNCSDKNDNSLKVIADHIRSCAFLIADGVRPSNEGRGYVLRRIIRRACRHGHKLGQAQPFFYTLVAALAQEMGEDYPQLIEKKQYIQDTLHQEEQRFAETLSQGMTILENALATSRGNKLDGAIAFQLYDTYGFPLDLTQDFAREHNLQVDVAGYEKCMQQQRARARAASKFGSDQMAELNFDEVSEFAGYEQTKSPATVLSIVANGKICQQLTADQEGAIVLDRTVFYAEAGGQVGDRGWLCNQQQNFEFVVSDTQKQQNAIVHFGTVKTGSIAVGDSINCSIDYHKRQATERNHSATHLLHWALRKILGKHVEQKGSLVNENYLRFDFTNDGAVSQQQLLQIETAVNEQIRKNTATTTRIMDIEAAKEAGALALFGEKYADQVRVLSIGEHSVELCGGTHVKRSGDIGFFKISAESAVAAGIRRIEALTAQAAEEYVTKNLANLEQLAQLVKTKPAAAATKVSAILDKNKDLEKELQQLKVKLAGGVGNDISSSAVKVGDVDLIATKLEHADSKTLRSTMDNLKQQHRRAVIVLATTGKDKVQLAAGVSDSLTQKLSAVDVVNYVAAQVGGKGGGRKDMAQAGGNKPQMLNAALDSVCGWLEQQLA